LTLPSLSSNERSMSCAVLLVCRVLYIALET
jgi:hypothetical protein